MTPADARSLLDWFADAGKRLHRYRLEGGQRRRFDCKSGCGWATEAENYEQARANLNTCPTGPCSHANMQDTGILMPPVDFS